MKFRIVLLFLFGFVIQSFSQEAKENQLTNPCLDKKSNAFIDRQDKAFLKEINETLALYPPKFPIAKERKPALYLLDAVLHDSYAEDRLPVQQFYHNRIEKALVAIENAKITEGAMIWKLYNMGFIVKTKSVTLAFDLVHANVDNSEEFKLPEYIMKRLIKQCDVLFISHKHGDHKDKRVAQEFIDSGKPVIAAEQAWKGEPIFDQITHLKRDANLLQTLPIKNGEINLKLVMYPGHQMSGILNNVPLIFTPEGISVSHMGDQINEGDFMIDYDWIDNVGKNYDVDILLPPCWTNELYRIVKGFDPKLVIPGHENELGHTVDDRVPFWGDADYLDLTNPELYASDYPTIQMTWGESYHYFKKTN